MHAVMEGEVPLSRRLITEALLAGARAGPLVKVMDGHVTKLTVQSGSLHALRTSFASSSSQASDFTKHASALNKSVRKVQRHKNLACLEEKLMSIFAPCTEMVSLNAKGSA